MVKDFIVRLDAKMTVAITGWPAWLRTPFLVVTTIGQPVFLVIFALCFAAALAMNPGNERIVLAVGAALGAMLINTALKHFIHRPRPDTLYVSKMFFRSSSFPSGHAFGTTVVFGLAAYLALHYLAAPLNIIWGGVFSFLILSIGVSRVYLGAHYPTDVFAGWLFGSAMLLLIIIGFAP